MGVKVPDDNMLPSSTNRFRGVYSATADANGAYATAFTHRCYGAQLAFPTITSGSIDWTSVTPIDLSCAGTMNTNYELVRTVAYGLRLKFVGSRINSQGKIHIACVGNNLATNRYGADYFPRTPAEFENCPWYANYSLNEICEQEIVVPGRRIDASSSRYRRVGLMTGGAAGNAAIETSDGWSSIVIFIEGALASNTVVQVEVVYHFEGLLAPGSGSFQVPSPAREFQVATLEKASRVSAHLPIASYAQQGSNSAERIVSMIANGVTSAARVAQVASPLLSLLA